MELAKYLAAMKAREEAERGEDLDFVARARSDVPTLLKMIEAARKAHSGYASDAAEEAMQAVLDEREKYEA